MLLALLRVTSETFTLCWGLLAVWSGPAKSVSFALEGSNPSPGAITGYKNFEKQIKSRDIITCFLFPYILRFHNIKRSENLMSYIVKDYMEKEFPIVGIGVSISETAKIISAAKKGYAIVIEDGKPIGIVTEWDLVSKILATEKDPKLVNLKSLMSSPLVIIEPEEDLIKAAEIMQKNNVRTLPVVTSGIIYGVITDENIARQCGEYVNKSVKDILRWSFPVM